MFYCTYVLRATDNLSKKRITSGTVELFFVLFNESYRNIDLGLILIYLLHVAYYSRISLIKVNMKFS